MKVNHAEKFSAPTPFQIAYYNMSRWRTIHSTPYQTGPRVRVGHGGNGYFGEILTSHISFTLENSND